jgi:methyl-accepting chemotaxis protein
MTLVGKNPSSSIIMIRRNKMLNWLKNIKIRNKLIGGFLVMIALLVVVFVISWNALNSLGATTHHIAREQFPRHEVVRDLVLQVAFEEEHYFAYASTLDEAWLAKGQKDNAKIAGQIAQLKESLKDEPELLALLEKAEAAYQVFEQHAEQYAEFFAAGEPEKGVAKFYEMTEAEDAMGKYVDELAHLVKSGVEQAFVDAERVNNQATQMILVVIILALVIALGLAVLLSGSITTPIGQLREVAEKISLGDLSAKVQISSKDEVGDLAVAFDRMVTAVRVLLAEDQELEG